MNKGALIGIIAGVAVAAGFTGFAISRTRSAELTLQESGRVLLGNDIDDEKYKEFGEGSKYLLTKSNRVKLMTSDGETGMIPSSSFAVFDSGSSKSFSGAVLLDFNDLKSNFINNYYIPEGMVLNRSEDGYSVDATGGTITFGDNLFKVSDDKYLVQSPSLKVVFSENDIRPVSNFVQVNVTEDKIVCLLTDENLWTTISEDCYIETESGVKVYPITQKIEDDTYKLSVAGLSVAADDNVILTQDQTRKQVVPKFIVDVQDGVDGAQGTAGTNGDSGASGSAGSQGTAGISGTQGSSGVEGSAGTSAAAGAAGATGANGAAGSIGYSGLTAYESALATAMDAYRQFLEDPEAEGILIDDVTDYEDLTAEEWYEAYKEATGYSDYEMITEVGYFIGDESDYYQAFTGSTGNYSTYVKQAEKEYKKAYEKAKKAAYDEAMINVSEEERPTLEEWSKTGFATFEEWSKEKPIEQWYQEYKTESQITEDYDMITKKGVFVGTESEWEAIFNGKTGKTGQTGDEGTEGKKGRSAYEVAQDEGFTGTIEEWYETLKGSDGDDGSEGETGAEGREGTGGTEGDDGKKGTLGDIGETGAEGTKGDEGKNGTAGSNGNQGTNGTNGSNGSGGAIGDKGTEGTAGRTAYQKAVEEGSFSGTEEEWQEMHSGKDGTDGTDGADGTNGNKGQNGVKGAEGTNGTNGNDAEDGENGTNGTEGKEGTNGKGGSNGTGGSTGQEGHAGSNGVEGDTGKEGTDGSSGEEGQAGSNGGTGPNGADAVQKSTLNAAIPVMTFSKWNVGANSLSGTIQVKDTSLMLSQMKNLGQANYPAHVTIYNEATGEEISCITATGSAETNNFFNQVNGRGDMTSFEFAFQTSDDQAYKALGCGALEPDTAYRISVTAYYMSRTEESSDNTIYSREFISRYFYTDSAGAFLAKEKEDINSVTVSSMIAEEFRSSVHSVVVFLLSPEQNDGFDLTAAGSGDYVYKYSIDYESNLITGEAGSESTAVGETPIVLEEGEYEHLLTVSGLSSDTDYVARVLVNSEALSGEKKSLTKQELELSTLKAYPTWDETKKPLAQYNRVTGAFEVYRPIVTDKDSGIQRYEYTAYRQNEDGTWALYKTQSVGTDASDPVSFYLSAGAENKYKFSVTAEFNDNEKTVFYDLGESDPIWSVGSTLPGINFVETHTFNSMEGEIIINLDASSSLTINPTHPLQLNIYADGVYDNTITLYTNTTEEKAVGAYGYSISKFPASYEQPFTNTLTFDLSLCDLYQNTDYSIDIKGYMNLGDGNGSLLRDVGTVRFQTRTTNSMTCQWNALTDAQKADAEVKKSAIAINLALQTSSTEKDGDKEVKTAQGRYDEEELIKGKVVLQLYAGQSTEGTQRGYAEICQEEDMLKLLKKKKVENPQTHDITYEDDPDSPGLLILASRFGYGEVPLAQGDYTIKVSTAADETYGMHTATVQGQKTLTYTNFYPLLATTKVLAAAAKPPSLFLAPQAAVKVTPILNSEAGEYGEAVDTKLAADAIIGYTVESKYDNTARLGESITYYALEYNTFFNYIKNNSARYKQDPDTFDKKLCDPIGNYRENYSGAEKLMTVTRTMQSDSTSVPKVAILFDGTRTETVKDASVTRTSKGYYVYHAGSPEGKTGGVKGGMSRGYRYVFAFTVEYNTTGQAGDTQIFPYDHSDYDLYRDSYGIGYVNGSPQFVTYAYVLNSGIMEAPLTDPTIHTYLKECKPQLQKDKNGKYSADLSDSSGSAELRYYYTDPDNTIKTNARISYYGDGSETPATDTVGEADTWNSVMLNYIVGTNGRLITPLIDYSVYIPDYSPMLHYYWDENKTDESYMNLGAVWADWDWDYYVAMNGLKPVCSVEKEGDNYIKFVFKNNANSQFFCSRSYALRVYPKKDGERLRKDGQDISFLLVLSPTSDNYYVGKLPVTELSDYRRQKLTFDAEIIYDNGDQGWVALADDMSPEGFGLRYLSRNSTDSVSFTWQNYLVAGNEGKLIPSGGLFVHRTQDYCQTLEDTVGKAKRVKPTFNYRTNDKSYSKFLYPTMFGIDDSGASAEVGDLTPAKSIVVPRGSSVAMAEVENGGAVDIEYILPSIDYQKYQSASTNITLKAFTVKAITEAKAASGYEEEEIAHELMCAVFCTDADGWSKDWAYDLGNIGKAEKGYLKTLTILMKSDGTIYGYKDDSGNVIRYVPGKTEELSEGLPKIEGLEGEKNYYLSFYMDFVSESGSTVQKIINGQDKQEQGETDTRAVYYASTATRVSITTAAVAYSNANYFNKYLTFRVGLSRSYDVGMEYEIYATKDEAERGMKPEEGETATDPAVPIIQLNSGTEAELWISRPTEGQYQTDINQNLLMCDLSPYILHEKGLTTLSPNTTYYVRATAVEKGSTAEVGHTVFTFRIRPTNASTVIEASERTDVRIVFEATVDNAQNKVMGYRFVGETVADTVPDEYAPINNKALYAVRFTDLAGNRIETEYDNYVYRLDNDDIRYKFALEDLAPEQQYRLCVYGVRDDDLDGLSNKVDDIGTTYTWDQFFGKDKNGINRVTVETEEEVTRYRADEFNAFINSFWTDEKDEESGNYLDSAAMDGIEAGFLMGYQTLQTAPAGGIYIPINEQYEYPLADWTINTNNRKLIRMDLKDSIGVVKTDTSSGRELQGFSKIVWTITNKTTKKVFYGTDEVASDGTSSSMFHYVYVTEGGKPVLANGKFYYELVLDPDVESEKLEDDTNYDVTVQAYIDASSVAADYTWSYTTDKLTFKD